MRTPERLSAGELKEVEQAGSKQAIKEHFQNLIKRKTAELEDISDMDKTIYNIKKRTERVSNLQDEITRLQEMWVSLERAGSLRKEDKEKIQQYFGDNLEQKAGKLREAVAEKEGLDPVFEEVYQDNQDKIAQLKKLTDKPGQDRLQIEKLMRSLQNTNVDNPFVNTLVQEDRARLEMKEAQKWVETADKI